MIGRVVPERVEVISYRSAPDRTAIVKLLLMVVKVETVAEVAGARLVC